MSMILDNISEMRNLILQHNAKTGHEIIQCNDPRTRTYGRACLECQDDAHTWETPIRVRLPGEPIVSLSLDELNAHTQERIYEGEVLENSPLELIPLEQLEPEADNMRWAVEHINMPTPPKVSRD